MTETLGEKDIIRPEWDAPVSIRTLVTTRHGGNSKAPFEHFNIAEHVGDNSLDVKKNRQILANLLPSEPVWLNQIHSNKIMDASTTMPGSDADGSYTTRANIVSVVMTADCLPVLLCTRQGNAVAAIHAGWRGLAAGILEQGVKKLLQASQCAPEDLLIWLGPAIGPRAFEVGEEVRQTFLKQELRQESNQKLRQDINQEQDPEPQSSSAKNLQLQQALRQCFTPSENKNKWFADIYQLARVRLSLLGVENISGGNYCTYNEQETFYSYRRDGKTGRMASLIWIEA